ncbi:hypothetical protein T440DRAFT_515377 [Plenodomus tracheiphilus IPT5]|uniref:Helicase C-terminal domain-containing protein n=1 Tax=Plenodomus tracheiphilus IPT5 TaxID=1408161 RepID=A0A6A7BEW9_9PLEO|nr:hypothetical protein T440DRAFT_515377 [Plenodomus tracheiphilus IPT5]
MEALLVTFVFATGRQHCANLLRRALHDQKKTTRIQRYEGEEVTGDSATHCEDSPRFKHRQELLESDLQDLLCMEEDADCFPWSFRASDSTEEGVHPAPAKLTSKPTVACTKPARRTPGKRVSAVQDIVRLSSRVAFDVPMTESANVTQQTLPNVELDKTEPADGIVAGMSPSTLRPRRNRARVSYVENLEEDELDNRHLTRNDSGSDAYSALTTDEESEEDGETEDTSLIDEDEQHMSIDSDEHTAEKWTDDDEPMAELPKRLERNTTKTPARLRAGKGIDLSLPPLNNVKDCFSDLSTKSVSLGLGTALEKLGSIQIKVATMCSGTESPLLALSEISRALQKAGYPTINFRHEFSAEIEPVKQGYIERNFQPKILFRDVRDFIRESTTTATTAYGAEVEIPSGIHILVAGFVCKDLSRLNNNGRTLKDGGESGDTWLAIYTYAMRFRPSIVLLENVMSTSKMWADVVSQWDKIDYEAEWLFCDTKNYYLPQTRTRMYMIAVDRRQSRLDVTKATSNWRETMVKLQRQCSSPYEAFIADSLQEPSSYTVPLSEPDWALCKLRYDHIRSKEKLGILSPVTQSNGSGTVRPPDFANRKYYESQSSRVWDAIDVAHLQRATQGFDSLYKMAVWDVSQNVDRFKTDLGIVPCITPGGSDFVSNRQQALSGSQLLLLQGMPLDRLLFANETQKDRQDLAGNAMSTTVIGASLIAAIIAGRSCLLGNKHAVTSSGCSNAPQATETWLQNTSNIQQCSIEPSRSTTLDLMALKDTAIRSARFCNCEGTKSTSRSPIRLCSACGYTACAACAGNPKHEYDGVMPASNRLSTPELFIRSWRSILPSRVRFVQFPGSSELCGQAKDDLSSTYLQTVQEARLDSAYFCIGDFARRAHHWTITYSSPSATLELEVGSSIKWLLYLKCPLMTPGNSTLREFLKFPIARGAIRASLLQPDWEVHTPLGSQHRLQLRGSRENNRSWRSRLGLLDFRSETVPSVLTVMSKDAKLQAVNGDFKHLPHCGTASSSLYKRSTEPTLYMFLDPNPIGLVEADSVVFSHDCTRKHYGESRMILATMDPSWRPWNLHEDHVHDVTATLPGSWMPTDNVQLAPAYAAIDVGYLSKSNITPNVAEDCSKVLVCLDVRVQEELPAHPFHAYSWALEQPRTLPRFQEWQETVTGLTQDCVCAPPYPEIHWNVDENGIASAREDPKCAAVFERAVKSRPSAIQLKVVNQSKHTQIQVGLAVASLLHRARSNLGCLEVKSTTWRLLTDHADLPAQPFAKFSLQSNSMDAEPDPSTLPIYLRGAQAKSLKWMIKQELGEPIVVTEVEEAVHPGLSWRLEARAQTTLIVRGGVLADHPSFGKTVTTIALIQHEFDEYHPDAIVQRNQSAWADGVPDLLDTAATLIVCPPHISLQWDREFKNFLGEQMYTLYNVLLIDSVEKLRSVSIEEVLGSKTIIVSWDVFAENEYISQLARFAAMPEPAVSSRRAFDTWLARTSEAVPDRLAAFQNQNSNEFKKSTAELLQKRLQQHEFQATLPLEIRHGSAYKSFGSMQASSKTPRSTAKAKSTPVGKTVSTSWKSTMPILHLFRFNRIVIDEYHYLNDEKNISKSLIAISVKKIAAHKRWVLSGTPAMANFSDINQIASFLGLRLGRTFLGDGTVTTQGEQALRLDQTPVEDFLSRTEIKSRQWHQARHDRAQEFLDLFVRQNEAQLEHISCSEALLPVSLDAAHHAVYLELSQHLVSQRMQLKKLRKKLNSDKSTRLNQSLNESSSAEIALIRSALLFKIPYGQGRLETLMAKRSQQRLDLKVELEEILGGFESLMRTERAKIRKLSTSNAAADRATVEKSIVTLYGHFKADIRRSNWLGDDEASQSLTRLLARTEAITEAQGFPNLRGLPREKRQTRLKHELSQARQLSREFALRTRSERFIKTIANILERSTNEQTQDFRCSAPQCTGSNALTQMHLISQCGHTACESCLTSRIDDEVCVHPGCNSLLHNMDLIRMSELDSIESNNDGGGFGNKLQAIVDLVMDLPDDDQGIVFLPDKDMVDIIEEVFEHFGISYYSLTHCKAAESARFMEDFKHNQDPEERRTMLILNLGSETAAGVNLTNANHIIFVSPLAVKTQYEYDSAMVQAIARSRRYGQQKKVHIYHVAAERTIDVDILEHRHKRNDGITTTGSTMRLPEPNGAVKEKTKLIKNKMGQVALVPRSWLDDASRRRMLNVGRVTESFTSLIRYEGVLEHDDE